MLGELPDGTMVKLEKGCECTCHNDPHWVYIDRMWRNRNRDFLVDDDRTPEQKYFAALALPIEEIARLDAKAISFRSAGIVRLIPEPGDDA